MLGARCGGAGRLQSAATLAVGSRRTTPMTDLLHDLLFDYTLRTVALGSAVLGMVSGALGVFAVLRRQSLVGDAMSHAALPGIVLAFMLTSSKAPLVLLIGATIAGWLG